MTIRFFTEEDVPAAAELEQLCFPDPWSQKGLRDTMREEGSCFLAAADKNGALCGYLNATWVLDECNLNRICVHPDFRKQGIGSHLLTKLQDFCKTHEISHIFLEVRESNASARNLYRGHGFRELGKRPRFYENPEEDAVLMEWTGE
ncbi:MAG TPA: ribosomal protein S18-alanine N-acetyltransferase [Candidatus Merdivicinus excrementipullorum]|uniref:[Ribosomal protein bS18]-alanine N-acetyltransferase n=1 Tax=Candidatus Merdivicinus excrementipullorum TaxID=2840867 RepID=A0A9D1FLQ3_9FIRM|nr:ribosomal protein S18-alanine N-acetyltransferase [Candidatus Merdivicinus excrementipullorum]